MLNYNMMIRSLRCVTTLDHNLLMYDGLTTVDEFLSKFESVVPEQQRFDTLKWTPPTTPMR